MILTDPGADSSKTKFDLAALEQQVRQIPWFHSIDLGNGIVTPGQKPPDVHRMEYAAIFDPVDIRGRTVIDIGAWNGAYSFEAKRRGAARILATDSLAWRHHTRGREGFDLARSILGIDLEIGEIDICALTPERVGTFDVVLLLGVFYHLENPIAALQQIAALAGEVLIVETHTDALEVRRPAMIMYPGRELDDDESNLVGTKSGLHGGVAEAMRLRQGGRGLDQHRLPHGLPRLAQRPAAPLRQRRGTKDRGFPSGFALDEAPLGTHEAGPEQSSRAPHRIIGVFTPRQRVARAIGSIAPAAPRA